MLGLIADSVIEDFLVVLEQDFNPSKVVVAVSGGRRPLQLTLLRSTSVWIWEDQDVRLPKLWRLYGCLKTKLPHPSKLMKA